MKKISFTAFCICVLFVISIVKAYGAEIKLGVIDTQRIMTQSKAALEARALFTKDYEEKNNLYATKQQEAKMLQDEINQKGKDMTQEVLAEKYEKYNRLVKELTRLKNDIQEDLESRDEELSQKLLREIAEVVLEFSKKENYTMILEKNSVVANDDAIDITDQIIDLYDATK